MSTLSLWTPSGSWAEVVSPVKTAVEVRVTVSRIQ